MAVSEITNKGSSMEGTKMIIDGGEWKATKMVEVVPSLPPPETPDARGRGTKQLVKEETSSTETGIWVFESPWKPLPKSPSPDLIVPLEPLDLKLLYQKPHSAATRSQVVQEFATICPSLELPDINPHARVHPQPVLSIPNLLMGGMRFVFSKPASLVDALHGEFLKKKGVEWVIHKLGVMFDLMHQVKIDCGIWVQAHSGLQLELE